MDSIVLLGAEQVGRAGHEMESAARTMASAALSINSDVDRLVNVLNEFVARFEAAADKITALAAEKRGRHG